MPVSTPRRRATQRRLGFVALVGVLLLAMLASTTGIAEAQRQPQRTVQKARPTQQRPVPIVETLRLACATDVIDGQRGVLCQWSEATNPNTRGYKLFRIVDGSARQLISTVGVDGRRAFFDTDIEAPATHIYGVISVNRNGRLLGRSEPVRIQLGQDVQQLRFGCNADSIDGQRGVLCRWSKTTQENARGYLLYRIVDGSPRELIARVPADGRLGHFDTNIVQGALHVYGVVAVDGDGTIIANSDPSRVQWPGSN